VVGAAGHGGAGCARRRAMNIAPPLSPESTKQIWQGKRVLVTGGGGFVGHAVLAALQRRGLSSANVVAPRSRDCDLRVLDNCRDAARGCQLIIHLAAPTGSVEFSRAHPASQYRDCSLINLNVLEAARELRVEKVIALGNLLAYPASASTPLREDSVYEGAVAPAYMGIALAKRQLLDLAQLYYREFGVNVVTALGANAYGPYDHFDGMRAHVIPSTIVKCFRDEQLTVWGDGSATRDFLFVDDLAEGLLSAAERLVAPDFVNVVSGVEVSIAELVRLIARLCGFTRPIVFDASKPGGDRRIGSTAKADALLGISPRVSLQDGLQQTINWYRASAAAS
jgi:GDP-L-fucose synthase